MLSNADFALEGAGQSPQVPARGKYRLVSQRCRIAGLRCAYLSDHNQMTASVNQFLNTTGKYGCLIQRRGDVRRARAFYSRKPVGDVVILSPGKAIGDVNLLLAQYIYAKFVVLFYGFRNKPFGAKINEHRGWVRRDRAKCADRGAVAPRRAICGHNGNACCDLSHGRNKCLSRRDMVL